MYENTSASQSTTSLSDNEEEDNINKSTFFQDPIAVSPAKWARPRRPSLAITTAPISRLPTEILIHVLRYLHTARDLYRCMLVCRTWCECSVELLWHKPSFPNVSTLIKMMRILGSDDQSFTYARFVRRLNFLFLGSDLSDVLFARVSHCVRLERLTLVNCRSLTDDAMTRVFHWFPSLVAIDLTSVVEVSDRAIIALATSSKRLQGINLAGCRKVSDRGILALARGCPLLRRVKLSNLEHVTDEAVIALAKGCSLILEIDLNHCSRVSDLALREVWTRSFHMREMRLSHCEDLTDLAFPAPTRSELPQAINPDGTNPFPTPVPNLPDVPPLKLNRRFDHLRMLDLTSCSLITDDAIEGVIFHAPKIRNLVLAKCVLLTDRSIESICKLGKHLHYLHLGHCSSITDASVRNLARSCTRLRYIDLANCTMLTDMAVFELSSLPKLRRVGLVRVNSLTDEAIYALGERHATLERIHLSYCNHITIMSIHFLLQKLPKLTHLSLTGIPAFRRPELQRFCRPPPPEFNTGQRAAFCVFSGKGVGDLREYLTSLFESITEDLQGAENPLVDDDYDEHPMDDTEGEGFDAENAEDADVEQEDGELDDAPTYIAPPQLWHAQPAGSSSHVPASPAQTMVPSMYLQDHLMSVDAPRAGPSTQPRRNGFGETPLVETSASPPPPSDAGSSRSSNGAGFFRSYLTRQNGGHPTDGGTHTPDLIFAEIGHGRGVGPSSPGAGPSSYHRYNPYLNTNGQAFSSGVGHPMTRNGHTSPASPPSASSATANYSPTHQAPPWARRPSGSSTTSPMPEGPASSASSLSTPPTGAPMEGHDGTSPDSRRMPRRTFRNALSSVFGRTSGDGGSGRGGGSNTDNGPRGY